MNEQDNLWLLQNRISKIFNVITQYGEENFYISFSGGMDSTVLSVLVDMALPDNQIPRVYADTGIEYKMIRDFVLDKQKTDARIVIINPKVPIKKMLEEEGYPFKSKHHSRLVREYQANPNLISWKKYYNGEYIFDNYNCPKCLKYHFEDAFKMKISDKCCDKLKKEPLKTYQQDSGHKIPIIGIMRSEGGRRGTAKCLAFRNDKLKAFQPLVEVTKGWEKWFIDKYDIDVCDIYKPPYNFYRTGCKGCPFAVNLQEELNILEKYFPAERKQCESIWEPVYAEYRRIGYRLKKEKKE